jgi:hypothetical protein
MRIRLKSGCDRLEIGKQGIFIGLCRLCDRVGKYFFILGPGIYCLVFNI